MQEAGFWTEQEIDGQGPDFGLWLGPDAAAADERILQQALAECYFDVQLDVIEWNTLFTNWRRGAKDPSANGANAINVTYAAMDPFFAHGAIPAIGNGAAGVE